MITNSDSISNNLLDNAIMANNLTCIFTGEYIDKPITVTCGHTFDRKNLKKYQETLNQSHSLFTRSTLFVCPICRHDLSNIDIDSLPKNITIANIIEDFKKENKKPPEVTTNDPVNWNGKWYEINDELSKIYCMRLETNSSQNYQKNLLIPIIDRSGSMSGSPLKQVSYSLGRMAQLAKKSNNILLCPSLYDDNFTILTTERAEKGNIADYGGGTNFIEAF